MNRHERRATLALAKKGYGKKSAKVRPTNKENRLYYVSTISQQALACYLRGLHVAPQFV